MTPDSCGAYDALIQFLYQAPIGLVKTTLDGEITMMNPMSAQLLMPLVLDGNLLNLFDALDGVAPQLRELAQSAHQEGGVVCDELRVQLVSSDPRGHSWRKTLSIRLVRLDQVTLVASVSDATQTIESENRRLAVGLQDATRVDLLTGLPNRLVAMERIAIALANARRDPEYLFAVMFIDCDRFDRVNVTLGSQAGDELLRLVGDRLNGTVRIDDGVRASRPNESAAARISSDQFVLVVQGMRLASDAHGVAQRVVDAMASPFSLGDQLVHITGSVGLVLSAQAVGEPEEVIVNANIAVHEAKRAGGGRYHVFDPEMKQRASRLGALESDLRIALTQGQLFVVYQPIIGMADGSCVGAEALIRWRHPQRGIVPPIEFIGVAEETGQIGALGEFVLNESCRQFVAWQHELGTLAPHTISINLSRAQLLGGSFPAQVRNALDAAGLASHHLQLEVTESLAAQDQNVIDQLHELKALGVSLALDDFGTGYSSLSSLHQLPVDVVKIDRSFVSQVEISPHHRVLIEATVMVARSLGMTTVAEGIETDCQLAALRKMGCDKGQGYLLSRPVTSEAFAGWLLRQAVPA